MRPGDRRAAEIFDPYGIQYLEYITPIQNLASIAERGILSHNGVQRAGIDRGDISDPEVQARRGDRVVGGRPLHDYVNLYFNSRNPMLYVRQSVQNHLAILCIDRTYIGRRGVWYSDGNAASSRTMFYYSPNRLYELNWDCIRGEYWNDYEDGRRIKCAEALVPDRVPVADIRKAVVRTAEAFRLARQSLPDGIPIEVDPRWFF